MSRKSGVPPKSQWNVSLAQRGAQVLGQNLKCSESGGRGRTGTPGWSDGSRPDIWGAATGVLAGAPIGAVAPRCGYSASGVGFSGGGSIPNVAAVMQVMEKAP